MRIVQLANFYTPVSGGLRTCVEQTGRGYIAAGHERVTLVPGTEDRDITLPDGRHLTVRGPLLPGTGGYRVLTARRRVCDLLDRVEPDVLEANDKLSIGWLSPWARKRGVPLVLVSHERINAILRTRVPRWFPLDAAATTINRRLHRLVDHIVLTSAFSAAEFEVFGRDKIHRVPLGVDLDTFRPIARSDGTLRSLAQSEGDFRSLARSEGDFRPFARSDGDFRSSVQLEGDFRSLARSDGDFRLPAQSEGDFRSLARSEGDFRSLAQSDDDFRPFAQSGSEAFRQAEHGTVRLVTVTRLSTEKHPELSILALRELRRRGVPATLDVIGTGPLQRRLTRLAEGLPVRFLGHVAERARLAELVASADISLSPSPAETFGLATLESLACGVPVVVPFKGAAGELILRPASGRVTDGTPRGLADGVESLLGVEPQLRRADARAVGEQFPWSATVDGLLEVFATATGRQRVP